MTTCLTTTDPHFQIKHLGGREGHHRSLQSTILAEILHRTANDFAMALSALRLAEPHVVGRGTRVLALATARITAAAELNRILIPPLFSGVTDLTGLLDACCAGILRIRSEPDPSTLSVRSDPIHVESEVAWMIVAIAAELIRNAERHAFRGSIGDIRVGLRLHDDELVLSVSDDGVGAGDWVSKNGGAGSVIVDALVEQLGGTLERASSDQGTSVRFSVPLSRHVVQPLRIVS